MCQQTRVDAADEKCSWDANQMFEGTSAAAAAGFWDVCDWVQAGSVAAAEGRTHYQSDVMSYNPLM